MQSIIVFYITVYSCEILLNLDETLLRVNTVRVSTVALKSAKYESVSHAEGEVRCDVTVFLPFFLKQPDLFEMGELLYSICSQ